MNINIIKYASIKVASELIALAILGVMLHMISRLDLESNKLLQLAIALTVAKFLLGVLERRELRNDISRMVKKE